MNTHTSTEIDRIKSVAEKLITNVETVIVGKIAAVELILTALFCEGHVLIEDVPGIGKTMMAKSVARSLNCSFKRIQCTPDLLPSDVSGIHFFNQKTSEFEFRPGPILANIVLVDEINRATPRTQSSLLESMQEHQVTIDLDTIPLPCPFMIIATQNPVELQGTFPLPEAQLDRFLLRVRLGYPNATEESNILSRFEEANPLDNLPAVINSADLIEIQKLCRKVHINDSLRNYIVAICRATRSYSGMELGASPRASLGLSQAAQALAAIRGRKHVIPDDIKYLAVPVLAHRLIVKAETRFRGRSLEAIINEIVSTIPVPVEESA